VGRAYPVNIESGEIFTNMTVLYGSSKRAAETGFIMSLPAGRVQFTDNSKLNISEFTYDKETKDLYVAYTNTGDTPLFFRPDATITIAGSSTNIKSETVYSLLPGKGEMVKFPGVVKADTTILGGANYGAREAFLEKRLEKEYVPLAGFAFDTNLLMIAVVVILVLVIGYLLFDKMKGHKQPPTHEHHEMKAQHAKKK
jgi:hypothetical protein